MSVAGLLLVRDIQGSFITAEINGRREIMGGCLGQVQRGRAQRSVRLRWWRAVACVWLAGGDCCGAEAQTAPMLRRRRVRWRMLRD